MSLVLTQPLLVAWGKKAPPPPPTLISTVLAVWASLLATAQGLPALVVVSGLVSVLGFVRYAWFFSLGYGLSMSAMAIACMVHYAAAGTVAFVTLLHASLVLAWGVRLATYLAYREFVAWPDAKKRNLEMTKKMATTAKISTWIGVTLFDALLFSPVLYGFKTPSRLPSLAYVGVACQAIGLMIESAADNQKSLHRKKTNTFVSGGLYKFSRHPNYLGEIIFWAGTFIAGIGSLTGAVQWISATLGFVAILGVMTGASNGLDKRQAVKYLETPGYAEYLKNTPKLWPFSAGDDVTAVARMIKADEVTNGASTVTVKEVKSNYSKNKNPWDN